MAINTALAAAEPYAADGGRIGVVVSHGFTGMPGSVRGWAEHLAAAGYSVRLPLLPGHGTSWQQANTTTWPQWYAAVEQAYEQLAARCDLVFAAGLSMGATLATRLAEVYGAQIGGLVLVNPSYATTRRSARFARYLAWAIRSRPAIGSDIRKPGVVEPAYERTPVRAFASLQQLWTVTRADLARISAPILMFRSRVDHVVEPLSAQLLQAGATGTTVAEVVLEHSYHVATLDHDAQLIFDRSLAFIESVSAGALDAAGDGTRDESGAGTASAGGP